jgi:hypothetical protein
LNKITCKCKRTWTSSWKYLSSKAPSYMLWSSCGWILDKISKKIGVCLTSWKTTIFLFYHTHKWQFGNKPYKWEGSWRGTHNLVPSILNDLQQNYRLFIVDGTLSISNLFVLGSPSTIALRSPMLKKLHICSAY